MTTFHVVTLFPDTIDAYVHASVVGRAIKGKKIRVSLYNPRDFTKSNNRRVDQKPYGGGPGMVLEPEPVLRAVEKARGRKKKVKVFFFSPSGKQFNTTYAKKIATRYNDIILIAGHYEGIDARVQKIVKAEPLSIGPYVLTGGEVPAMAVIDAVSRFIPSVLGNAASLEDSRIASPDVYTRPEVLTWKGKKHRVPKVLLSGNHKEIESWKAEQKK